MSPAEWRQRRRASKRRYNRSSKGRAASARYERSEKGRARSARFNRTAKGRWRFVRYNATLGGIERRQFYEGTIRRLMRAPAGNPFGGDAFAGMATGITAQIQERRANRPSREATTAREQEIVRDYRERIERDGVEQAAAFYSEECAGDRSMSRLSRSYFDRALQGIAADRPARGRDGRGKPKVGAARAAD